MAELTDPRAPINGQPPKFPAVDPRALIEAATPLPWQAWMRDDPSPDTMLSYRQTTVIGRDGAGPRGEAHGKWVPTSLNKSDREDAALIVYAVNNLPALLDIAEALERLLEHFDGPTLMGSCQTCWLPADEANDQCREHVAREALARLKESR